jgi:FkbM family methyltransferase
MLAERMILLGEPPTRRRTRAVHKSAFILPSMPSPTFASFSQNGEDVVLWRALQGVPNGRYVDVGANDPEIFSVSMGFYQRGWSGITIEPDPEFAQMQRDQRPRDWLVEAAITPKDRDLVTFHVVDGTGLSTLDDNLARAHQSAGFDTHDVAVQTRSLDSVLEEAGWEGMDIHFMSVDTEGSEQAVLESLDLTVWRPWVLVVEATSPLTTESTRDRWEPLVTGSGYRFCMFDGLSCFYVAEEHEASLGLALSYPACPLDNYTRREYRELEAQAQSVPLLTEQVSRWRNQAVNRWAKALAAETEAERLRAEIVDCRFEADNLRRQVDDLHRSSSWRVTKPLRLLSEVTIGRRWRRSRR